MTTLENQHVVCCWVVYRYMWTYLKKKDKMSKICAVMKIICVEVGSKWKIEVQRFCVKTKGRCLRCEWFLVNREAFTGTAFGGRGGLTLVAAALDRIYWIFRQDWQDLQDFSWVDACGARQNLQNYTEFFLGWWALRLNLKCWMNWGWFFNF